LKIKTSETISVISQEQKEDAYGHLVNVKAFKIDVRIIFANSKIQIDIVSGEIAKNDQDMKIITDEGKLCRETKDAVDSILSVSKRTCLCSWITDKWGCLRNLNTTIIKKRAVRFFPLFSFTLPSCITELGGFLDCFKMLYSFQQYVIRISHLLEEATNHKHLIDKSLGTEAKSDAEFILDWRREIFYTTLRNKEAKIPSCLFGRPSSCLITKLFEAKYNEQDEGIYDAFGWGFKDNKWHNKITEEVQDESPY
jgi:hypothetical protein